MTLFPDIDGAARYVNSLWEPGHEDLSAYISVSTTTRCDGILDQPAKVFLEAYPCATLLGCVYASHR